MAEQPENLEIERKFLVRRLPDDYKRYPHQAIAQGYLTDSGAGTEIRVRRKGERFFLTAKQGRSIARLETEIEISPAQFEALWPLTEGRRIEKIRYEIPYQLHTIELDVYQGRLAPLVTAEVEFDSLSESEAFMPPGWMSEDISNDAQYRNRALADR